MVSFCKMREFLILLLAGLAFAEDLPPTCERPVYCDSALLHHVQMARIFEDSKTFVDLQMKYDENKTLDDFQKLLDETNQNPSVAQLTEFVSNYFSDEGELEDWIPSDLSDNPLFLYEIKDQTLRQFGKDINDIWPLLARRVKAEVLEHPERFSLVPLTHGFIIPGGRFKEIYYWDSFWIVEGLLISGMKETAKGMIENLIELLNKFGHIPNGSRWYYEQRSQPPMLTAMVAIYYQYTNDIQFIRDNIQYLEKEMDFWLNERSVTVEKDGGSYRLLRFYSRCAGPRPESYYEDFTHGQSFSTEQERTDFYIDIKSGAESGWDYSTRWFITADGHNNGSLTDIHTRYILPADLNAMFAGALQHIAVFNAYLLNIQKSSKYGILAKEWRDSIEAVLWHDEDAMWYDYNIRDNVHRRYFYSSNVSPLWMNTVSSEFLKNNGARIVASLKQSGGLDFPGSVPTSLIRSGEQWDFPNVWPPQVSIVVNAIHNIGTEEAKTLALEVATSFVRSCLWAFQEYKQMFEKYDAENPGKYGGGGEYAVQLGFGWSNGAVLEFLKKYSDVMTAEDSNDVGSTTPEPNRAA